MQTRRLRLSALAVDGLAALPWLAGALAPEWRLPDLEAALQSGEGVSISDAEASSIGIAVVMLTGRTATVPFLAIEPARRFRGLGGEAVLALERHLRARMRVETVYAPVPEARGLAVYFWLRLGYRPLLQAEEPDQRPGLGDEALRGIWLARDAD